MTDAEIEPGTEPFWQTLAEGGLTLPWCAACDAPYWYPRPHCPTCGHDEITWIPASGRGIVYSATTTRPRDSAEPRHLAVVELEEGIRLFGLVDSPDALITPGSAVALRSEPAHPGDALRFVPADTATIR